MVLAAVVGGMLLCSVLAAMLLRPGAGARQLGARLREVSGATAEPAVPSARAPSIRVVRGRPGALSAILLRALRYNPEIPRAHAAPWTVVVLVAGGAAAVGFVFALRQVGSSGGWVAGLAAGLAAGLLDAFLAARTLFGLRNARYARLLFDQLPDVLGLMTRSIRAGLPLAEALRGVAGDIASPTREEFRRVAGEMAIGGPVEDSLVALSRRTGVGEYSFLAVTLGLQAQTGGSLAETLENLSDIVRKRVAMRKRAAALAGEAKMQAGILVILPFAAAAIMATLQPFYLDTFLYNPTGQAMAITGLTLMGLGLLTIRWLIRRAGQG